MRPKKIMKKIRSLAFSILALALQSAAQADPVQSNTATGDNARQDNQLIGDTNASENHSNSQSTQLGNSANANGATITTGVDTRDQNTVNSTTSSAGGSSTATGNTADNKSSVGNTTSSSGGNSVAGGAVTGANTSANTNNSTSAGGTGGQSNSTSAGGTAAQGQGQRQGITGSGNSDSRISTGPTVIAVDTADRSSNTYRATTWAPVIHGSAAPALAAGALVVVPGQCGPRVLIVRRDVIGTRFGLLGGQQDVVQGQDEIVAPAPVPFAQVGPLLMGHAVTVYTAILGTSSAASLSLAGYGKDGQGAQGGGAASGQLQQIVQRVVVRECVYAHEAVSVAHTPAPIRIEPTPLDKPVRQDRN